MDDWIADLIGNATLVALGAILTLASTLISAFLTRRHAHEARQEDNDRLRNERRRASVEELREASLVVYREIREEQRSNPSGKWRPSVALDEVESKGYLQAEEQSRDLVDAAVKAIRSLGPAVDSGNLEGTYLQEQSAVAFSLVQALSAMARGDEPESRYLSQIKKSAEATESAWTELIETEKARRV